MVVNSLILSIIRDNELISLLRPVESTPGNVAVRSVEKDFQSSVRVGGGPYECLWREYIEHRASQKTLVEIHDKWELAASCKRGAGEYECAVYSLIWIQNARYARLIELAVDGDCPPQLVGKFRRDLEGARPKGCKKKPLSLELEKLRKKPPRNEDDAKKENKRLAELCGQGDLSSGGILDQVVVKWVPYFLQGRDDMVF